MEQDQVTAIAVPPEEGRFCADCKHLVGVRHSKYDADKWNCGHENNAKWADTSLITGVKKRIFKFTLIELRYLGTLESSKAGMSICGPEGRWYERYEKPAHYDEPPVKQDKKSLAEEL
jgi:hypothetical protein